MKLKLLLTLFAASSFLVFQNFSTTDNDCISYGKIIPETDTNGIAQNKELYACHYKFSADSFNSEQLNQFSTFINKLSAVPGDKLIALEFSNGTFNFNKPIKYNGPFGYRFRIYGQNSKDTILYFPLSSGIDLDGPVSLGLISKIKLKGNKNLITNDANVDPIGIGAARGSTIRVGRDVIVDSFPRVGIQAFMMSSIALEPGTISQNNGSDGIAAGSGATILARGSISQNNRGDGFFADFNGSIDASYSQALNNYTDTTTLASGIAPQYGRGGDGYVATTNGSINANGAKVSGNIDCDFHASNNGIVYARNLISTEVKTQIKNGIIDTNIKQALCPSSIR